MEKKINASVAIQVLPNLEKNKDIIKVVDKVIEYIHSKNLKTVVGPFETTIEGNYDDLMEIVKQCQIIAIEAGAPSVMSYVKINYTPKGEILTIEDKISKYIE